jgi:hypothetical protein
MALSVLSVTKRQRRQSYDNRGRPTVKAAEFYAKPRIYLDIDMGEDGYGDAKSQMEHILFDRYSARDLAKLARDSGLIRAALTEAGLNPELSTKFSQKAGCSCGCSPALILSTGNGYDTYDLWVTIGDADLVAKAQPWRAATKYITAVKRGRDILRNANLAGPGKHQLKKLQTYFSTESYHKPFVQA